MTTPGPQVRLYLSVYGAHDIPRDRHGTSRLYTKTVTMWHLPRAERESEDQIHIWGDVAWSINRRYWEADGSACLDLIPMQIDPDPNTYLTSFRRSDGGWYRRPWWTDRDDDPIPPLLAAGWREWTGEEDE